MSSDVCACARKPAMPRATSAGRWPPSVSVVSAIGSTGSGSDIPREPTGFSKALCYPAAFVKAVARANRLTLAVAFIGLFAAVAVRAASADFRVDDGPCPEPPGGGPVLQCPTAHVGLPYRLQIEAEDGCAPYNWFEILNGSLPSGLTMTRAGLISGTPTGAGLGDFWLGEHDLTKAEGGPDWCNFDDQSQKEFNIPDDRGATARDADAADGPGGAGDVVGAIRNAASRIDVLGPGRARGYAYGRGELAVRARGTERWADRHEDLCARRASAGGGDIGARRFENLPRGGRDPALD